MAVLSDYTSGTITLANGSTAVTGTGTLFDVAKFREGDTLQIQNLTAVIASVNSNTSLTLTAPWSGTSLADAPYRARYLPDGARVTAQATTLIELLGNGVLSNLAELGVEDGKVPVGNAAGEYELKDQSTFGVQDPNGSLGKLAALTLAANKILNTNASGELTQSDITDLGLNIISMANGQSVYGSIGAIPDEQLPVGMVRMLPDGPLADARSILENGTFLVGSSTLNIPINSSGFIVMMRQTANYGRQIYYQRDGSRMFTRNWTNNVWGSWTEIGGGNVTGSGWIRLPSGLIIQWGTTIVTTSSSNLGIIPLNTTFPSNLYTSIIVNGDWGVSAARPQGFVVYPPNSNTSQIAFACGVTSGNVRANWIAIGA